MKLFLYRNSCRSSWLGSPCHTLRIILALAVLTCSGCFGFLIPSDEPEKPKNLDDAPLEIHVAHFRKEAAGLDSFVGRLPRDLSVPDVTNEAFDSTAGSLNHSNLPDISSLEFLGLDGDQICVGTTDFLEGGDSTPAAELAAKIQGELETGGIWVEAVESLDALTGRKAWPPGPTSARLVSAEVVGDEFKTFTKRKPYGDGYVEVKEDNRVITFKLCGPKLEVTPGSNYLIAVVHTPPSEYDRKWDPATAKYSGPDYAEGLRMQHDSLLVWVLTDDGTIDLSK